MPALYQGPIPLASSRLGKRLPGPVRWYGGKGLLVRWIMPHVPWSQVYCEPYGGAASLLCALKPRPVEVYNDLDGRLVNLFRVLQNPAQRRQLADRLGYTPYAREEFELARRRVNDPAASVVERAWAFFVCQNQGFSGAARSDGYWSRSFVSRQGMAGEVSGWRGRVALIRRWALRFARVRIDQRDALEIIRYWDSPDTVFYCDPPYPQRSRARGHLNEYAYEASDGHWRQLVRLLLRLKGRALLSCYRTPLTDPLAAAGWTMVERNTSAHAAGRSRGTRLRGQGSATKQVPRIERLWIAPSR